VRRIAALQNLDTVRAAPDLGALSALFVSEAESSGFSACACAIFPRQGDRTVTPRMLVGRLPSEWTHIFDERGYHVEDPLTARARNTLAPFRWSEALPARPTGRVAEIMSGRAAFGFCDGVVVPIHTPDGEFGRCTFFSPAIDDDPELSAFLQLLALAVFDRAAELTCPEPCDAPCLSTRERECLRWVAAGKSDADIGAIIGVCERTAHFHVENAKRKLRAPTRVQALVLALKYRLFEL
jgi:DNA-binding CsgD family transcriptional regulator